MKNTLEETKIDIIADDNKSLFLQEVGNCGKSICA
jgi:hypothetical protein